MSLELDDFPIEKNSVARFSVWQERKVRNNANANPTQAFIQTLGNFTGGVEYQQSLSALTRHDFGYAHQRLAKPLPTCATVHQHLGQISTVRLVFRLAEYQLHRSADA